MPEQLNLFSATRQISPTLVAVEQQAQVAHWYATYTCSRQEKQVAKIFENRQIPYFLPLYQKLHRHNGGARRVFLPLFPGYVFVHISLSERLQVLEVPGIVQLVSFRGAPAVVSDVEIETIQKALAVDKSAHPCAYVRIGQTAVIESGPLKGLRGKLLRSNSKFRAVLSVDLLQRSFVVDVDERDLAFAPQAIRPSGVSNCNAA